MFLSQYLVFKIVLAAVTGGRIAYPTAADLVLKYDSANKLFLSGGALNHVRDITLFKDGVSYELSESLNLDASNEQILFADDAEGGDEFGNSCDVYGEYAVVGASKEHANGVSDAGSVYVYHRPGNTWIQQAKLTASDGEASDYLGGQKGNLAIYGDTVVVGAHAEDTGGSAAGSAYVFVRSGTTWSQQAILRASNAGANDQFGMAVAIYKDTIVIGAPTEDTTASDAGSIYVFTRSGTTWTQRAQLQASNAGADDMFGLGVSISGDYVIVGAPNEDTVGSNGGSAYIFKKDTGAETWTQQAHLQSSDIASGDSFGQDVSISGNYAVVGANYDDDGGSASGSAYVFVRSGTTWTQQAKLTASDAAASDDFGRSVDIDKDRIVVAAYGEDTGGSEAGAIYVFSRSGSTWTEIKKIQASNAGASDYLGYGGVGIHDGTIITSSPNEDTKASDAGAAYIYGSQRVTNYYINKTGKYSADLKICGLDYKTNEVEVTGSITPVRSWKATEDQILYASDAATNHYFGSDTAISGNYAIVGAYDEDVSGGTDSGAAYIFYKSSTTWSQQAKLKASDPATSDKFGHRVDIEGDYAIVGAYNKNSGTGAAYIFKRSGTTWTQQSKLTASNAGSGDEFGRAVGISGDYAFVGARREDTGGTDRGSAYIFKRASTYVFTGTSPSTITLGGFWYTNFSRWYQKSTSDATSSYVRYILWSSSGQVGTDYGTSFTVNSSGDLILDVNDSTGGSSTPYYFVNNTTSTTVSSGTGAVSVGDSIELFTSLDTSEATLTVPSVFAPTLTDVWSQHAQIQASDAQDSDNFGWALSVDGDYAIVGAYVEDTGGTDAGSAYIFYKSGTTWSQQAKIQASDKQADDRFGVSVDIKGEYVIVGADYEDTGGSNAGSAYVFVRSGTSWTQQAILRASDAEADDRFGGYDPTVSISDSFAVVGSFNEDAGGSNAGAAYVFSRSGSTWTEVKKIVASNPTASDVFGQTVAIDGTTILVGAREEDTKASAAGAAYIFERSVIAELTFDNYNKLSLANQPTNTSSKLVYGSNVYDIDTLTSDITIEKPGEYVNLTSDTGSNVAYFSNVTVGAIASTQKDYGLEQILYGTHDSDATSQGGFGHYIDFNGDGTRFVLGLGMDPTTGQYDGRAKVYHLESGTWTLKVDIPTPNTSSQRFGDSVCMNEDGTRIVVNHYPNIKAYIYDYASGAWPTTPTATIIGGITNAFGEGDMDMNKAGTVIVFGSRAYGTQIWSRAGDGTWSETKNWGNGFGGYGVAINGAGTRIVTGKESTGEIYEGNYVEGSWGSLTSVIDTSYTSWPVKIRMDSDGTTLIVNADPATEAGIYERQSGTSWTLSQSILSLASYYSRNGLSISYDGNMVLVGDMTNDTDGNNFGRAFLWNKSGGSWSLTKTFSNPKASPAVNDYWGAGVAIAKNTKDRFIIGMSADSTAGNEYGSVYVHTNAIPKYLDFDTYNKLSISSITPISSTLKYFSNTYDIGTASNIYIDSAGTYDVEITASDKFALVSNVVGSLTANPLENYRSATIPSAYLDYGSSSDRQVTICFWYKHTTDQPGHHADARGPVRLGTTTTASGAQCAFGVLGTFADGTNRMRGYTGMSNNSVYTYWDNLPSGFDETKWNFYIFRYMGNGNNHQMYLPEFDYSDNGSGNYGQSWRYVVFNLPDDHGSSLTDFSVYEGNKATTESWRTTLYNNGQIGGAANETTDRLHYLRFHKDTIGDDIGSKNTDISSGSITPSMSLPGYSAAPSLTFDGYNKYTFTGADTGSTYKLKYLSNTYDLGTISNVYIANPGTYSAEIKSATNFALTSNVTGAISTPPPGTNGYTFSDFQTEQRGESHDNIITFEKTSECTSTVGYWNTSDLHAHSGHTCIKWDSSVTYDAANNYGWSLVAGGCESGVTLTISSGQMKYHVPAPWNHYFDFDSGRIAILSPSLTFDGFNKYTFANVDTGSTYKLKYLSNTYDLGTASNVYIANPGTYSAEIKSATNFVLTSNAATYNNVPRYVNTNTYSYTGSDQTISVPSGVTRVKVVLKGAGGGHGYDSYSYAIGGTGGYTEAEIELPSGTTSLTLIVGQGGDSTVNTSKTYGGGGGSGNDGAASGGRGGGRTAVRIGSTEIATAGGGGGGSYNNSDTSKNPGFNGGGLIALGGTDPQGGGGTQTTGGSAGDGSQRDGEAGAQYEGGTGSITGSGYGGAGGGGGWYGGGGGGGHGGHHGAGGGGSGFAGRDGSTVLSGNEHGSTSAYADTTQRSDSVNNCKYKNVKVLRAGGSAGQVGASGTINHGVAEITFAFGFTHDGYKLSIQSMTPTSSTLKYGSNTYEIGSATNIYVKDTGAYTAEIGNATDFVLTSNTVSGTIKTIEPMIRGGFRNGHALTYDGKLYAWGKNTNGTGELGVGDASNRSLPTLCTGITQGQVAKFLDFDGLQGRSYMTWIKTTDNKIYATGNASLNQIPGHTSDLNTFTDVTSHFGDQSLSANNIIQVSTGAYACAGLTETGNVWTWGRNDNARGNLGNGGTTSSTQAVPAQITFSSATDNITKLANGHDFTIALDNAGDVWLWGTEWLGSTWNSASPIKMGTALDSITITDIAASYNSMHAISNTGVLYASGDAGSGQIMDGSQTDVTSSSNPDWKEVTYFSSKGITINKVYPGTQYAGGGFVDTSDGWYAFGGNSTGNLGLGDTSDKLSPVKFTGVSNIKKFAVGYGTSYAVTEDGKYYAWGEGAEYARGDNATGAISYPKYIDALPNILAPSFDFDGYDKVFVNTHLDATYPDSPPGITFSGNEYNGLTYKHHSTSNYIATWDLYNGNSYNTAEPYHRQHSFAIKWENDKNFINVNHYVIGAANHPNRIKINDVTQGSSDTDEWFELEDTDVVKLYTWDFTLLGQFTVSKSDNLWTGTSGLKFSKNAIEYDAGEVSLVTVSDTGTYDAQLSQYNAFHLKSATVPATSTSGLYTWAFHHGNFDNAYGDGDILTARDNGRFYADTPVFTSAIGTITPGATTTSNTTYTFAPPSGGLTANVMMVAGGGGGGGRAAAGGGGAGGLVYTAGTSLAQGATKTIVVGNGDSGGYGEAAQNGYDGKDTTFTGLTTADGGGGGGNSTDGTGVAGGSGGGGGGSGSGGAAASGSQGTAGGASSSASYGGGGGGAGAAGSDYSGDYAGDGGTGKFFGTGSSFTDFGDEYGEGGWFAGGGAGGSNGAAGKFGGTPGRGGGGYGGNYYGYMGINDSAYGGSAHGMVHTGSGGGGSGSVTRDQHPGYNAVGNGGVKGHGGRGGSGIVLIQTNVAPPNGANTAVVQVGNPRRRSLPPTVAHMGSEVNRWYIIDSQSMPTYKLPTHWYADPNSYNGNYVFTTQGSHSLQKRADGGTSNVWYASSGQYFAEYGTKMAQTADAVFMPVEQQRYDVLLSIGQNTTHDIQLEMAADGTAKLTRNDGATLIVSGTIKCFTVGKWHHIALTVDSEHNAVGYVNGHPVVSTTYTSHYDVGTRSGNMHMRVGVNATFRKFLTYEVSTYNFHMSPKQVLQRAAEVGLGPKLEYDGLNAINVVNTEPNSSIKIYEQNTTDTSNLYVVACNTSSYTLSNAATYYAEIKGTETYTITRPLTVSDDHFPLYQYPPYDGTTSSLTQSASADTWNTWTISGASNGNGQYQAKTTHSTDGTNYGPYRPFNNDIEDGVGQLVSTTKTNFGITLQLPSAKTIRKYRMYPVDHNLSGAQPPGSSTDPTLPGNSGQDSTSRPNSWVLKGSNDGTSWTDLDTVNNKPISIYGDVYSIDSPASYQYYQMFVVNIKVSSSSDRLRLGEWQLWGDA